MRIQSLLAASVAVMLSACDGGMSGASDSSGDSAVEINANAVEINVPFEKFTLDNGLTVVVHEDRKAPIVAVSVWYHVGSKDEPEGKTGFAHLFEHLMFNGSENYNDEYFKPFEEVGATAMNGTTWFDRTNYFQNVPTPALDMALWMESDRMGHLLGAITQDKLDEQRGVVQNEKRQGDNQPYGLTEYRILEGLYPEGHPYRWSTIGSMDDLNAASLEDVKEWFKAYYGSANTVVVLAGDIDAATARPLMEKYFGDIPAGPPVKQMKSWVPDRAANTAEVMFDSVPQTRIYRTWAVPGRISKDAAMLSVAASVLGDGKNSRLYQALVYQNQLAVSVSANMQPFELTSQFSVEVTLKPGSDVAEVEAIIDAEMAKFLAEGPSADEVARAATGKTANTLRGLEQIGGFGGKATALAQSELYAGDPAFFMKRLDWINGASAADVKAASNAWLSDGLYQLTVYPYGEHEVAEEGADRSGLPAVGEMPELVFPEIQTANLSNGIEVVLAERATVPVVNLAIQFDAGYAADQGRPLGTASYTMAMLDEGTTSRGALEISAEAEKLGANLGTGSTLDTSQVQLSALKANLEASVALMADVVRNPAFSDEEIERLRQRWLAGIQQEKAQPVQLALRTLPPLLYGEGHAYGIPLTGSGTEDAIAGLSRDDLVAFHTDWLRPDNGRIMVVGDTTMDELLPVLEGAFGDWQAPATARPEKNIAEVALPAKARVIILDKPGSPQSMILAGHISPPSGDPNNLTNETMNDVFGGKFTARINMNLREDKGWAYGAYTFIPGARGQRPYIVYAPVQTDKTSESLAELLREFSEYLGERPASQEELERVIKDNTRSLPGQFETSGAVLGSLMSNARYGRDYDYVTTLKGQYEAMTTDGIMASAHDVLAPDQLVWLIIGDREKIEAGVRALGIAEVEVWDKDGNPIE